MCIQTNRKLLLSPTVPPQSLSCTWRLPWLSPMAPWCKRCQLLQAKNQCLRRCLHMLFLARYVAALYVMQSRELKFPAAIKQLFNFIGRVKIFVSLIFQSAEITAALPQLLAVAPSQSVEKSEVIMQNTTLFNQLLKLCIFWNIMSSGSRRNERWHTQGFFLSYFMNA